MTKDEIEALRARLAQVEPLGFAAPELVNALPALLDAADEADRLRAEVERLRKVLVAARYVNDSNDPFKLNGSCTLRAAIAAAEKP